MRNNTDLLAKNFVCDSEALQKNEFGFSDVPFFNVRKSSDFLMNHGSSSLISLSRRLSGGFVMTFMILSYMDVAILVGLAYPRQKLLGDDYNIRSNR